MGPGRCRRASFAALGLVAGAPLALEGVWGARGAWGLDWVPRAGVPGTSSLQGFQGGACGEGPGYLTGPGAGVGSGRGQGRGRGLGPLAGGAMP